MQLDCLGRKKLEVSQISLLQFDAQTHASTVLLYGYESDRLLLATAPVKGSSELVPGFGARRKIVNMHLSTPTEEHQRLAKDISAPEVCEETHCNVGGQKKSFDCSNLSSLCLINTQTNTSIFSYFLFYFVTYPCLCLILFYFLPLSVFLGSVGTSWHLISFRRHYLFETRFKHGPWITMNSGIVWAGKDPPVVAFVSLGWKDTFVGRIQSSFPRDGLVAVLLRSRLSNAASEGCGNLVSICDRDLNSDLVLCLRGWPPFPSTVFYINLVSQHLSPLCPSLTYSFTYDL